MMPAKRWECGEESLRQKYTKILIGESLKDMQAIILLI